MKPYWPATMQLMPADLQARDTYVEKLLAQRMKLVQPYAYGIIHLTYDERALAQGDLVLHRFDAIFPSGLPISVTEDAPLVRNVATMLQETASSIDVFIGVPKNVPRGVNVSPPDGLARSSRYLAARDEEFPWMRPQPEILFEREPMDRFEVLTLGRIRKTAGTLSFDTATFPTVARSRAANHLQLGLESLVASLQRRRDELLHERADHPLDMDAPPTPAFRLLLLIQRHLPLLEDLAGHTAMHPRELYRALNPLYGRLRTFGADESAPKYVHDKLGDIFPWFFKRIARIVDEAARPDITALPFENFAPGRFSLAFQREQLLGKQVYLVATGANERYMRENFVYAIKMASPVAMPPLLDNALPGVEIAVDYQPPQGIPRRPGLVAYRIDMRHNLWLDIEDRQRVDLFAPSDDASLRFFLYGVRANGRGG